jgi:hypothetical protein
LTFVLILQRNGSQKHHRRQRLKAAVNNTSKQTSSALCS